MNRTRFFPEFSLLDLIQIVSGHRRFFIALPVIAAVLSFAGSFLIKPQYKATSSLLPPLGEKVQGYSSVLERGVIRGGFTIRNTVVHNSLNLERLLGRELRYAMVDSLGLVDFFDLSDEAEENPAHARELAAEKLLDVTHFELSLKIRVLIIHVMTHDPVMSARIANSYLDHLDRLNLATIRAGAAQKVAYLDERLADLRSATAHVREQLLELQEEHGIVDFSTQRGQTFEVLGRLRSRLLELEIDQGRLLEDYQATHPEVLMLDAEIGVYRNILDRFYSQQGSQADGSYGALDFPLSQATDISSAINILGWDLELLRDLEAAMLAEREKFRLEQFLDVGDDHHA